MLLGPDGKPLDEIKRRELKSGVIKKLPQGDAYIKLVVDIPEGVSQDDAERLIYEYGNMLTERFKP